MAELSCGDRLAVGQLSQAAQSELMALCEEQFTQMEKLQNKMIMNKPDSNESPQEQSGQSVNRLQATEAELKQWMKVEPKLLSANSEILLQAGKEEMLKLCSELEMVASCYEAKRDKLMETKEIEQKWLEEKKTVFKAVCDHIERLKVEREKLSEFTDLQDIKQKVRKMKSYHERLLLCLGYVLEKHIPPLDKEFSANMKKKNIKYEYENLISLNDMLEILMNKLLNSPHDPYVTLDETFWPPYVELLLRHGIAVRHQENNFKIRLETFF